MIDTDISLDLTDEDLEAWDLSRTVGGYSARAAHALQKTLAAKMKAEAWLDNPPSHPGSCNPEMGCDGVCMVRAHLSRQTDEQWLAEAGKVLRGEGK